MSEQGANSKTPAIRFKGFSGEWEEKIVGDMGEITTGSTPNTSDDSNYGGSYLFVSPIDIQSNRYIRNTTTTLTKKGFNKGRVLNKGDILFVCIGSTIGKVGQLYKTAITNQQINAISTSSRIDTNFVFTLLQNKAEVIKKLASAQAVPIINKSSFSNIDINIASSKKEQTQIGNFFQQLDRLIAQHQQKYDKLLTVKKALLEKMFPQQGETQPAIRFKGFSEAWEEMALGGVAKIKTGSSNREDSGLDGKYTFFDRSEDIRTSNIFLFDCEAVIVAGEGSDFVPKYFFGKFDLHQRTYAIMEFKDCDGKYLFYYIHFFRKHFLDHAVGSTVKSLRLPMFEEMPIQVPIKKEQTKIGRLFQQLDTLINQHQSQLTKLGNIKQSMLTKLFV